MAENYCASDGNIMILACSGGSNVGQISNRTAIELTREGFGKMFCRLFRGKNSSESTPPATFARAKPPGDWGLRARG